MSEQLQDKGEAVGGAKSGQAQGGDGRGCDPWQVTVVARLSALERDVAVINERTKHLVTKEDLGKFQLDMQQLCTQMVQLVESQNRQLRWTIGGMGAMLLAVLGTVASALFQ